MTNEPSVNGSHSAPQPPVPPPQPSTPQVIATPPAAPAPAAPPPAATPAPVPAAVAPPAPAPAAPPPPAPAVAPPPPSAASIVAGTASPPQPTSALALVTGIDPANLRDAIEPGPAWLAPLSMAWRFEDVEGGPGEFTLSWSAGFQRIGYGPHIFRHDGRPTMSSSSGVARLLLVASAPSLHWHPVGEVNDVRIAEFNAAMIEMLLDMVLTSSDGSMPVDSITSQIIEASEWFVRMPAMTPFPLGAQKAIAQLMTAVDDAVLMRLSPIFFERRKVDRRGFDPGSTVAFKFRADQTFDDTAKEMQSQVGLQLRKLRTIALRPKEMSELTADELILRAFTQPEEATRIRATDEVIARLRRLESMAPQQGPSMATQLAEMMMIVASLYPLIKPACRSCGLPATRYQPIQGVQQPVVFCDTHGVTGKDLPAADIIRAAAFIAAQSAQAARMTYPPQPMQAAR